MLDRLTKAETMVFLAYKFLWNEWMIVPHK